MNKFKKLIRVMAIMLMVFTINVFGNDYVKDIEAYSITDGKVTIDIPEYDEIAGWSPGEVKTATVTVDFEDSTSTGKKVKVKLPTGLRYVSYPVVTPSSSSGLKDIEQTATGTFATLLSSNTSSSNLN